LGLDGISLITEQFAFSQATVVSPSRPEEVKSSQAREKSKGSDANKEVSAEIKELQAMPGWQYIVKNNIWYTRNGSKNSWSILLNPTSIKSLIKTYNQGYFIKLKKLDTGKYAAEDPIRIYQFNKDTKKWEVKLSGIWQTVEDPALLNQIYGADPFSGKMSQSTGKTTITSKIDKDLLGLANSIKGFVEGNNFNAYKGGINDDEGAAWNNILFPEWKKNWKPKLNEIKKSITSSIEINADDRERYLTSIARIRSMFTKDVGKIEDGETKSYNSFYGKFLGSSYSDTYDLMLKLSGSQVLKISIDTDF